MVDALLRGALHREGAVGVHLAAMVLYVCDVTDEEFDMAHRPFFLRFATTDRAEREAAFTELCERIGRDPVPFLEERT